MKTDSFTEQHNFTEKERTIFRLIFWHYEYLKRHLHTTEKKMCEEIFIISSALWYKAKKIFPNDDMFSGIRNIIKMALYIENNNDFASCSAIPEHMKKEYFKQNILNNSIITIFNEKELRALDFLRKVSEKYEYFALDLLLPANMSCVLTHINENKDVADFQTNNICIIENDLTCAPQIPDYLSKEFSPELAGKAFISELLLKRVHAHTLVGRIRSDSADENQVIAQAKLYPAIEFIRESTCLKRACGLWCYDRNVGFPIAADEDIFYDPLPVFEDLPEKYPAGKAFFRTFMPTQKNGTRKMLHELREKQLYFRMPEGTIKRNYKKSRCKECPPQKLTATRRKVRSLECDCEDYTACETYIRSAMANAYRCVEDSKIITISRER